MISLVRVDNRLIHGQVVEAWLPHLNVQRVAVADDEAAGSPLMRAAMGLAVPGEVEVTIQKLGEVDFAALSKDPRRTLLLFRDVSGVVEARKRGLEFRHLNLGNVHFSAGRRKVSPSVFLDSKELGELKELSSAGVLVEASPVPHGQPLSLGEIQQRFEKSTEAGE